MDIPFNKPYMTGEELECIRQAHQKGQLAGDGFFTDKCHELLEKQTSARKALLTHSCTAALEMAALLCDLQQGDEVIMPSYTFVSTANAFVLRGAVPVFVDIRTDTLNIDESAIEEAITPRTKAIVPVHYAGVACEMDIIGDIARQHDLFVIEDAAQGIMATYKDRPLGSIGDIGCLSFHETKNVISGEGGALLVNDPKHVTRAEIIRQKGTDRCQFLRGEVDKYTWVDVGSSYLPGEVIAAFLYAQLQNAEAITAQRIAIWNQYHNAFEHLEQTGRIRRPVVSEHCRHNAHMYYLLADSAENRTRLIASMKEKGVYTVFHYIPLHSSPAGKKYTRISGSMRITEEYSERLIRLPLWPGMTTTEIEHIIDVVEDHCS